MHFQQFEDFKFQFFSGEACPRTSIKPLQGVQLSQNRRDSAPILLENPESRLDFSRDNGEYPDCEDQLSPAN